MVFFFFWGFCYFLLYHFENWWVFGVFAASYFIILRIGEFLGFLGFLLLHTLSFCELMGFLLLHTLSFCELVGFWGVLGFLLLHTLSF